MEALVRLKIDSACPLDFEAHKLPQAGRHHADVDIGFGHPKPVEVLQGQIDSAAFAPILSHVAQEIRELHRKTQVRCGGNGLTGRRPHESAHHQSDNRSRPPGIAAQVGKGRVPIHGKIHFHRLDESIHVLEGDVESARRVAPRSEYGVVRLAGQQGTPRGFPPLGQTPTLFVHREAMRIVDPFVGITDPGIQGVYGRTKLSGEKLRREVVRLAVRAVDLAAVDIRGTESRQHVGSEGLRNGRLSVTDRSAPSDCGAYLR